MTKELLKDVIDWDIINWSRTIPFWEKNLDINGKNLSCLELGGRKGGLSLWLALKGNNVICSDLNSPESDASELHKKYRIDSRITYQSIDATNIPFDNHFDIITFKSILGGISRDGSDAKKKATMEQIYQALNKGGKLLFAENLEGSGLHKYLRKRFISWGKEWNYLKLEEIPEVFSSFNKITYVTIGFWGAFGRTEKQRAILGRLDGMMERLIPSRMRYIVIGIAEK
jgi:SAM-dependent methyltransferase